MFLFIFESIGTSELILVGIVALVFLGPRKLPQIARKFGKIMAEFRGTAAEFKQTWEREVSFEEEANLLDPQQIEAETVVREKTIIVDETVVAEPLSPEVKEIDAEKFEELRGTAEAKPPNVNDKRNWL